jgi:quercetin dioxygenase-like cupin family protein
MEGHDTGVHDHGGSSGGVCVVKGDVVEERLSPCEHFETLMEGKCSCQLGSEHFLRSTGSTFSFGPDVIHRVLHAVGSPAISIHSYSPPLKHMTSYGVVDGKVLDGRRRATPSRAGGAQWPELLASA